MRHQPALLTAASFLALSAASAFAETKPTPSDNTVSEVVVTAQRLDEARNGIQTQTGASTTVIDRAAIDAQPGGGDNALNTVMLQAPGVAQDSFGQLHVRGEHNGLQYRLNGVILPEGISTFSQTLNPRLADKVQLITGALPAEYGLRTAGIIDITTRSGVYANGGQASVYGGAHDSLHGGVEASGSAGPLNVFVSGNALTSGLGIESPDGRPTSLHDHTTQQQAFAYLEDVLDPDSRLSLIVGTSRQQFEIPNRSGVHPDLGLSVHGVSDFASDGLDETQREITHYGVVSYLHTQGELDVQASLFARYSSLFFKPDALGDLLFDGVAQTAYKRDVAGGLQLEGAFHADDAHTLRGGLVIQADRATSVTASLVLPVDGDGGQTSDTPLSIPDNSAKTGWTYSLYLQDEWSLTPSLTFNYGGRFDAVRAFDRESQFSPRVNLVWKPTAATTVHAGYSRYFSPPPFELVGAESVAKFQGTTAQAPGSANDTPKAERANYFDLGVEQQATPALSLGVDGYYKRSRNLIDEGQFGAPIVLTTFNYRDGVQYGVEFSANYLAGPLSAYASLAVGRAMGRGIVSSQFEFDPGDLDYIAGHYIHLDHDQTLSGSAGVTYRLGRTTLSADMIYGSGLRTDGATPNGAHLPAYATASIGVSQDFDLPGLGGFAARLDVVNLFDKVYEIRDGQGVGVGAPQFGARRGVFAGLVKTF